MMVLKLQVILAVSSILFTVLVVNLIRRESLELKYSLIWLLAGFSLICLALFPFLLDSIAAFIGIISPVNALFLVGNLFLISIVFNLTFALSRNSIRIKDLAHELALLKLQLEELGNQAKSTGERAADNGDKSKTAQAPVWEISKNGDE